MAGDPREIGTAYVTVKAKIDDVEQNLDKVQDKLEEVDQTTNTVTDSTGRNFGRMAEDVQTSVTKQVGVLTGLVGSITSVIGTVTLFYNVGKQLGDMFRANEERADKLEGAISRLDKALDIPARRIEGFGEDLRIAQDELGLRIDPDNLEISQQLREEADAAAEQASRVREVVEGLRSRRDDPIIKPNFNSNVFLAEQERELLILEERARRKRIEADQEEGRLSSKLEQARSLRLEREAQALADAADKARDSVTKGMADPVADRISELTSQFNALRDLVGDGELGIDAKGQELLEAVRALSDLGLADFPRSLQDANKINNDIVGKLLTNENFRQSLVELLGDIPKSISELQKQQKELPDKIGKAVEDGTRRVLESTGLLATAQTLAAIRTNADLILSETRRLGN